jgi:Spy/CpxP family protein refolding chaperone
MRKHIGILTLAALFTMPTIAQESQARKQEQRHSQEHRKGAGDGRFHDLPGLTEAQKAKLKSIHEETRKANEPKREEMKAIREKMKAARMSENPDQAELNRLIDRSHALKADMEKTRVAGEMKAMSILTPEQQAAYKEKMKERGQRWEKGEKMEHRMKMERNREHMRPVEDK